MHALIFSELQAYTESTLGGGAWNKLLDEAGIPGALFAAHQDHPDATLTDLVRTATRLTSQTVPALLEDFGTFIAPHLLALYPDLIDPTWRTLDVLANTEHRVHSVVRARNPNARPPRLQVDRISKTEVVITYTSQRHLCPVAIGIAKGLAKHYDENASVSEPACMHRGALACKILVRVAS